MNRSHRRRRAFAVAGAVLAVQIPLVAVTALVPAASAADLDRAAIDALDQTLGGITGAELVGDPRAVAVLTTPMHGFPTQGSSALILSTGDASVVADPASSRSSTKTQLGDDAGTILNTQTTSASGHDLTQVAVKLAPPSGAGCVGFDFMFLTEEFPNYKGKEFNDVFTAELGTSTFTLQGSDVQAPNNFAFSADKEVLSLNAFSKFVKAPQSSLNGRSEQYSATSPLDPKGGPTTLYLTVQDLGDSYLDSAVVVDNVRYLGGAECGAGTESKVDTDGDGIPDIWETNGIDIDKDGKPELDLPAMGANPQRKDVFVEIDWMNADPACTKSRLLCAVDDRRNETPTPEAIKQVVDAFASAPVSNPNGSTGITLHVDYGPESPKADGKPWGALAHGSKIPFKESIGSYSSKGYDWTEFEQIRDKNSEQVRRAVFRYTIFGYAYAGAFKSSGFAALPGNRMMVTSHDWPWPLGDEAGTFMHELGHNLGLKHGGDKNVDYNEGYYSVMNYDFQFPGVDEKGKLDYSTGKTDYKLPLIEDKARNRHPGRGGVVPPLDTFDDWSNLKFDGHGIGALGASVAEDEEQVVHEVSIEDMPVRPGAAGVAMIGPTLVAQGVDRQVLIADITNLSSVASDYTLRLDVPWAKEPLAVEVPAETTGRVEIPIAVAEVHEAAVPVTASLYHGKELMSTSAIDINVVDLSDPIQAQAVSETLAEIAADPLPGLDPGVVAALDSTIAPEVGLENLAEQVAENTDAGSSLPIPRWALGALGGGVLLLLLLAFRMVRSKKA